MYNKGKHFIILIFPVMFLFSITRSRLRKALTLSNRLPLGFSSCAIMFICTSIALLAAVNISGAAARWVALIQSNLSSPLGQSRLMKSVMELADSSLPFWLEQYRFLFFCFSIGILLTLYKFCKALRIRPWVIIGCFELILINIFYYHSLDVISNIGQIWSLFYLTIVAFIATFVGSHIYAYWCASLAFV